MIKEVTYNDILSLFKEYKEDYIISMSNNSKYYADRADTAVQTMNSYLESVAFDVDFTTGKLIYTSAPSAFGFDINTTTGHLEWDI